MSNMQSYRRRQHLPPSVIVILIVSALLLIVGGLGFIVYLTSVQYTTTIHATATMAVQSTRHARQTAQVHEQETANVLSTEQAAIYATATEQVNEQTNQSATATATVDLVTATAGALSDQYSKVTSGRPAFDDSLSDNTGPGKWDEGPASHTGCAFMNGGYHASEAQQGFFQPCFTHAMTFDNFVYQVNMTINKGFHGQGGILFRTDSTNSGYYFFRVSVDGMYALDVYTTNSQTGKAQAKTLTRGLTSTVTPGLGSSNQIAVMAKDNQLYLFVNGEYVDGIVDRTFSSGGIGVAVLDTNAAVDATFSGAQVWKV